MHKEARNIKDLSRTEMMMSEVHLADESAKRFYICLASSNMDVKSSENSEKLKDVESIQLKDLYD